MRLTCIAPSQLQPGGEAGQYDVSRYALKFLAQGDSWFSLGHVPFWATTNLLQQMALSRPALAVNCAHPGAELAHMMDMSDAPEFVRLLAGSVRWSWDAVLVSGGGNDLIDIANAPPSQAPDQRLLLLKHEWKAVDGPGKYVSDLGWVTFSTYIGGALNVIADLRDAGQSSSVPIVLHTYDYITPRNAPAGPAMGPWLCKAMTAYGIPVADWDRLSDFLIDSLASLLKRLAASLRTRNVLVIETRGTLSRAKSGTGGVSRDWENEIHPTPMGYMKLGTRWRPTLDKLP